MGNMEEDMLEKANCLAHRPKGGIMVKPLANGDFSDCDRIFYLAGNLHMEESLLLFSRTRQQFIQVNPTERSSMNFEIDSQEIYEDVVVYDNKLFCIHQAPLALDVFFSSKKRRFYHKRSFHFMNENLEFKGQIHFMIWKHDEADMGYRCLLGPLKDGRFINFTLREKNISNREPIEQRIDRIFFVSLALDSEKENPPDILPTLEPGKNTILCYDKKKKSFFEYGDFSGNNSVKLEISNYEKVQTEKLKRMYFHYPYDHYPEDVKKRLKKRVSSMCKPNTDVDKFTRNRYKKILLCMEGEPLHIMRLDNHNYSFGDKEFRWEIDVAATGNQILPVDIAIDEVSGRIYVLDRNCVYCLKSTEREDITTARMRTGREDITTVRMRTGRESSLVNTNWES